MSKRSEKIQKLVRDTLLDGVFIEENKSSRDIVDECESHGKLFTYKGIFIASVRSSYMNNDCIRIVFVLKESDTGKVKDIEKVFELIEDIETALINIDKCNQVKNDGFIYVDIIKKMIPED